MLHKGYSLSKLILLLSSSQIVFVQFFCDPQTQVTFVMSHLLVHYCFPDRQDDAHAKDSPRASTTNRACQDESESSQASKAEGVGGGEQGYEAEESS